MSHRRKAMERRKLKKLHDETWNSVFAGAYWNDRKQRYVRFYTCRTPGYTKYLRRLSNRRVRHSLDVPMRGSGYRKHYDYWWELY